MSCKHMKELLTGEIEKMLLKLVEIKKKTKEVNYMNIYVCYVHGMHMESILPLILTDLDIYYIHLLARVNLADTYALTAVKNI